MSSKQVIVTLPTAGAGLHVNVSPDCVFVVPDESGGSHVFIGERGVKGFLAHSPKPALEAWEDITPEVSNFKLHVQVDGHPGYELKTIVEGNAVLTAENKRDGSIVEVVVEVVTDKLRTSQLWCPSFRTNYLTKG